MFVMRWTRGHWVAIVLLTLIVALVGGETTLGAVSPVQRGAWYRASGRQPHFSQGSFSLQFRVTRNGRQVTSLQFESAVSIACSRRWPMDLAPGVGSARIAHDGTFRAGLRITHGDAVGTAVTVTGRFLSDGRAQGTLRYRGQRTHPGCNADGTWTGHAWSLLPAVQHFTGTTDQDTRVTFERTIERYPRVTNFSFSSLRGRVPSGQKCLPADPVATRGAEPPGLQPPWHQLTLPVKRGRFSGKSFGGASVTEIRGRFDTKDRSSGTVIYTDRGDCNIHAHWTARRTS